MSITCDNAPQQFPNQHFDKLTINNIGQRERYLFQFGASQGHPYQNQVTRCKTIGYTNPLLLVQHLLKIGRAVEAEQCFKDIGLRTTNIPWILNPAKPKH